MNDHDRSIRIAAASLSESLVSAEASLLEQHLRGCASCRREHAALANDHRRLRALVAPQPVSERMRADVLAEVGIRRGAGLGQLLLVAALLLLLVAALALRSGSPPPPPLPIGFGGTWTTTNCATWWAGGAVDCDRWGDGTSIVLSIGQGEPATIRVSSAAVPDCVGSGSVNITPPMVRDGTFMWLEVEPSPCGRIELGEDGASHLYLDPGDQRIWFDDDGDGWGLFWTRAG